MSGFKGTPGPWRVDGTVALGAYGVWTDYGTHPGDVPGELYPDQVCSVYHMNKSDFDRATRDANAKLIAESPNLLAELIKAHTDVCSLRCPSVKRTGEEWTHSAECESIRAAIAKAV